MKQIYLLFILFTSILSINASTKQRPVTNNSNSQVAVLIVPGAEYPPSSYNNLKWHIELQLGQYYDPWVEILENFGEEDLDGTSIIEIFQNMTEHGFQSDHVLVLGHSLPKHVMSWFSEWGPLNNISAVVGIGCDYPEGYLRNSTRPTYTIQGDLDGVLPVTELQRQFWEYRNMNIEDEETQYTHPLSIIEDFNHNGFLGDNINITSDIESPKTQNESSSVIAEYLLAFVAATIVKEPVDLVTDSKYFLGNEFYHTTYFFTMFLDLYKLALDGSWATIGQEVISAVSAEYLDRLIITTTELEFSLFLHSKPHIEGVEEFANISIYYTPSVDDEGNLIEQELLVKYKTREAVMGVLEPSGVHFINQTTCKDINQLAIDHIFDIIPSHIRERYLDRGRPLILLEDDAKLTGSGWINSHVLYNSTSQGLNVQSSNLVTAVSVGLGLGGMNYCKLMPPSLAFKYILIDSLRRVDSF